MKIAAFMRAPLFLLACVPATEDLNPRGAAGFDLVPSATSRGESFTTADGYTLTIERAVFTMQAVTRSSGASGEFFGSTEEATWDSNTQTLLFVRALPIGQITLLCEFGSISSYDFSEKNRGAEPKELSSFTRADLDRIRNWIANPNEVRRSNTSSGRLVVSAQKDSQSWTLDVVLPSWYGTGPLATFNVRENVLERQTVTVMPENIFRRTTREGTLTADKQLRFQGFVDADTNSDSVIDEAELSVAKTPPGENVKSGADMYETLRNRLATLLVLAP
jgi:hypothetical protein